MWFHKPCGSQVHYYDPDELQTPTKSTSHPIADMGFNSVGARQSVCSYHTPYEARSPSDITNMSPGMWRGASMSGQGHANKAFTASPAQLGSPGVMIKLDCYPIDPDLTICALLQVAVSF